MNRDWMFGVAMALAVALYPNLIEAAVYSYDLQDAGAKCWLIFFSTAGPALVAPVLFGIRTTRTGDLATPRRPHVARLLAGLAISGIFAAGYFLAVLGFGAQAGLGPGLAEIIDSSFFPIAYIAWLALVSNDPHRRQSRPPFRAVIGAIVICVGLLILGAASKLGRGSESIAEQLLTPGPNQLLMLCAVAGAAAAAIALWLLRQLVRTNTVALGGAIAFRYGAPAVVFLLVALLRSGLHGLHNVGLAPVLTTLIGGAILVNCIYLAAIRIDSDLVQAAAMGLVPLFTLALERAGSALALLHSRAQFDKPVFWLGFAIAVVGIVLAWRDPVVRRGD